jgi:hypothetical protein
VRPRRTVPCAPGLSTGCADRADARRRLSAAQATATGLTRRCRRPWAGDRRSARSRTRPCAS